MLRNTDRHTSNLRQNTRIKVYIPVDVSVEAVRCAFGEVTDISRDGMGVEVFPLLTINKVYRFRLRGFGTFNGKVVRRFGIKGHGIVFQINEAAKVVIDERILGN